MVKAKTLLKGAAFVLSLTLMSPALSMAGVNGNGNHCYTCNGHGNGNHENGNGNNHRAPEPGTLLLLGSGLAMLYTQRKRLSK
ncbi:MAG: PEP-CTERM sorting domain-containing protein [Deltaproteobacteria bacterium]|nr:PEP-CTERM sorting domain-containing protein [Deltaproteobacteria bacterium]